MPSFYMGFQLIDLKGCCCLHDNPTCTSSRRYCFLPATTLSDVERHIAYFIILNNICTYFLFYFVQLTIPSLLHFINTTTS